MLPWNYKLYIWLICHIDIIKTLNNYNNDTSKLTIVNPNTSLEDHSSHYYASMYDSGDLVLAGLFTIHLTNVNRVNQSSSLENSCHGDFNRRSFQMVQAMRFAIGQINNNDNLLPGIKLGYEIKDTCETVEDTIRAALNYTFVKKYFIKSQDCHHNESANTKSAVTTGKTVAVIGPDTSDLARAVADFCGLFQVPIISPAATSILLEDRDRFKYFFRTVPSDKYQVQLLLDLIAYFEWNFIILIVSDDEYGRSARMELTKQIKLLNLVVCLTIDERVHKNNEKELGEKLKKEKKAKVIILIANLNAAKSFIDHCFHNNITGYTWVGSDAWAKNTFVTNGRASLFNGLFGVSPLDTDAEGYKEFLVRSLEQQANHVWVKEFLNKEFNGILNKDNIKTTIMHEDYNIAPYQVVSTINAVYGIAHALHAILDCNTTNCVRLINNIDWSLLVNYVNNVSFKSPSNKNISFSRENNSITDYKVWNLNRYKKFEIVGSWSTNKIEQNGTRLQMHGTAITWNTMRNEKPESVCSSPCAKGTQRYLDDNNAVCCWSCVKCVGNSFSNITNSQKCRRCPNNYWPNKQHTNCYPIKYIYLKMSDPWGIAITLCTVLLNGVLFVTLIIFLYYRSTPVIRASSRGLCYIIMFGTCLFFIIPLLVIGETTKLRCKMILYLVGIALSVNIGTLLVKTNRIARIFSRKLFRKRQLKCLSVNSQYVMIFTIVMVEVTICIVMELALNTPTLKYVENLRNDTRFISCVYSERLLGIAMWCTYNAGLIIICTYQAFLVRKVPTNYNEAKFIAFTMITICIAVLGYIPVYFGTSGYYREIVACFLYLFTGCVQYISLFIPKLYIVIFRPDKNVSMKQRNSPKTLYNRRASAFESDGDYIPTERELNILNIRTRSGKRRKSSMSNCSRETMKSNVTNKSSNNDNNNSDKTTHRRYIKAFKPLTFIALQKKFDTKAHSATDMYANTVPSN